MPEKPSTKYAGTQIGDDGKRHPIEVDEKATDEAKEAGGIAAGEGEGTMLPKTPKAGRGSGELADSDNPKDVKPQK